MAHNVPKNSETHFRLVIVSDVFDGLSRVKRHQLVYKAADEALKQGITCFGYAVLHRGRVGTKS